MRTVCSLFLLSSWQPVAYSFLTSRHSLKRSIHSYPPRVIRAVFLSESPESANRNFITNLIEGDIKENKVVLTMDAVSFYHILIRIGNDQRNIIIGSARIPLFDN